MRIIFITFILLFVNHWTYAQNNCYTFKVALSFDSLEYKIGNPEVICHIKILNLDKKVVISSFLKAGFESDEDDFANIVFRVYSIGSNNNLEQVTFSNYDAHYLFGLDSVVFQSNKELSRTYPFYAYCPINKRGIYKIFAILRFQTLFGYLSFQSEPVKLIIY